MWSRGGPWRLVLLLSLPLIAVGWVVGWILASFGFLILMVVVALAYAVMFLPGLALWLLAGAVAAELAHLIGCG